MDNNQTRKRTRHEHFPKERYKKPIDKQTEMNAFYQKIKHYPLNKIICLNETSVGSALHPTYSRCYLGRRCRAIKTSGGKKNNKTKRKKIIKEEKIKRVRFKI